MTKKVILLFALCMVYTFLRYVYFGPKSPENIPLYLMNKAVSMGSVIALLMAAISYYKKEGLLTRDWGKVSLHSAFLHVFMSFPLITPEYYAVFYGHADHGKMDHVGELVLLFGTLAAYFYYMVHKSKPGSNHMRVLKICASCLVAAHIFELGAGGWLNVAGWHGSLPPITLITTIAALAAMALYTITPAPETLSGRSG